MKKLFKIILNTIPRPLLIRLSHVARPVLAALLKGDKFTDPIDGKSFRMFLLMVTARKETTCFRRVRFP
jgi:hypothetical protein